MIARKSLNLLYTTLPFGKAVALWNKFKWDIDALRVDSCEGEAEVGEKDLVSNKDELVTIEYNHNMSEHC